MERIRNILYEASLIILAGVSIAVVITVVFGYFRTPTVEHFIREYAGAHSVEEQIVIAEKYFDRLPLQEMLDAIESHYADIGCHIQGHAIGRVLYRHNPNVADTVQKCGGACTYGCFHGVQMEMFDTDSDTLGGVVDEESPEAYTARILSIAKDICTKPEVQSVVRLRQCLHGLGHMFVYNAKGDLRTAVQQCDALFDTKGARSCRTGAYMEKIFTATTTSPEYLASTQPCDAYPGDAYICYRYKAYSWLHVYGSIAATLSTCDSFGELMIDCIAGTASAAATPELLGSDEGMESICGSLDGVKRSACEAGAFLNIINLNGGDDSEHVCDIVAPHFRDRCLETRRRFSENIYYGSEARHLLPE